MSHPGFATIVSTRPYLDSAYTDRGIGGYWINKMIRIDEHGLTQSSRSKMHGSFMAAFSVYFISFAVGALMLREVSSLWLGGSLMFVGVVIGTAYLKFGLQCRGKCEFCDDGNSDHHGLWPASGWSVACCHSCYEKHGVQ